jgi:enolase-phosphatase E1
MMTALCHHRDGTLTDLLSWEEGYRTGAYSTPLFADVAPKLKQWKSEGKFLAIYSSGSVFAQKLLMEHIDQGSSQSKTGDKRVRDADDSAEGASSTKAAKTEEGGNAADSKPTGQSSVLESSVAKQEQDKKSTEDLRHLISGWFDTTNAGMKADNNSYSKIAEELKVSALRVHKIISLTQVPDTGE